MERKGEELEMNLSVEEDKRTSLSWKELMGSSIPAVYFNNYENFVSIITKTGEILELKSPLSNRMAFPLCEY